MKDATPFDFRLHHSTFSKSLWRPWFTNMVIGDSPRTRTRLPPYAWRRATTRRYRIRIAVAGNPDRASCVVLFCGHRRDQVRRNTLPVPCRLPRKDALVGDGELRSGVVGVLLIALLHGQGDCGPVPVVHLNAEAGKTRKLSADVEGIASGLNHLLTRREYTDGIALRTYRAARKIVDNRKRGTRVSIDRPAQSENQDEPHRRPETAHPRTEGSMMSLLELPRNRCRHRELLLPSFSSA